MCEKNRALVSEKIVLLDLKNNTEEKMQAFKSLVSKKDEKIKEMSAEFEERRKISRCSALVRPSWIKFSLMV